MKKLLLITDGFPFRKKEEGFLSTELKRLCQFFDVSIVALTSEQDVKCAIPERVSALNLGWTRMQLLMHSAAILSKKCRTEVARVKNLGTKKIATRRIRRHELIAAYYEKWLYEYIIKNEIQIIYTYWCTSATLAAVRIKKKHPELKLKVISRFHGYDLYVERTEGAEWQPYREEVSYGLDRLCFISKNGLDYYQNNWAVDSAKCLVSYLGTKAYERVWLADEAVHTIVSCSDCNSVKRIDRIIESLANVSSDVKINWIHVGDGLLLDELKVKAAESLDGKNNITYTFAGWVNHDQLNQFYRDNHVELFITLSESEGLPISVTEALAMGIPSIATNVGGMNEIVNENNGYLVDKDIEPLQVAKKIENHFKKTIEERQNTGNQAVNHWKQYFSAEDNSKEFVSLLCDL